MLCINSQNAEIYIKVIIEHLPCLRPKVLSCVLQKHENLNYTDDVYVWSSVRLSANWLLDVF